MIVTCLHEHRDVSYFNIGDGPESGAKRFMKLDYYLCDPDDGSSAATDAGIEPETAEGPDNYFWSDDVPYGIRVIKTEGDIHEEARVADVTTVYKKAKSILLILADNQVTPCSLRDVLEDICAAEYTV